MIRSRAVLSVLVVAAPWVSAVAQDTSWSQQPTFRSQSNAVLVPALVKDKKDQIIYGLEAKDFIVEDDGVEQPIHMDEAPEFTPVSLVIAVQIGLSAEHEQGRIRALGTMLDPVLSSGLNRAALVTFDGEVKLERGFTTNGALIAADLKHLRHSDFNGAAILNAVRYSVGLLKQEPKERQRVLLLISETRDHGSQAVDLEAAVQAIADSNTVVYALAFSPTVSNILDDLRGNLERRGESVNLGELATKLAIMAVQAVRKNAPKAIAEITGGEYELFKSEKGFESRMVEFTNHLHNRYLLSFEPRSPHDGLHEVRVRLRERSDVSILARTRYWAASPNPMPVPTPPPAPQ
jgi:VWFA-related protein